MDVFKCIDAFRVMFYLRNVSSFVGERLAFHIYFGHKFYYNFENKKEDFLAN